ncbi:hypothetical protein BGW42_005821 [Actinomortierella wolfii]|nr:hypothetical protein BGW42_005821 [Actinomortierella wolfii]
MSFLGRYLRNSAIVLQVACGYQVFSDYVAEWTFCFGPSMLPTLNVTGDLVVFERLTPKFSKFEAGDVVVAVSPFDPTKLICKRVIGVAGDKVCIDPIAEHRQYITVPPGHFWLTGDNLKHSLDSREYGPVAAGLILGKVVARLYPSPKWIRNGLEKVEEFA